MPRSTDTIDDPAAARRLQSALDMAAIGVWEYDRVARRVFGAPAADALFGLDPAAGGRLVVQYLALVLPDDRQALRTALGAALANAAAVTATFRARGADGRLRWIECHAVAAADADGSPRYLVGSLRDVTAEQIRARASAALDDASDAHTLGQRLADLVAPALATRAAVLLRDADGGLFAQGWSVDASALSDAHFDRASALALGVERAVAAGAPLVLAGDDAAALGVGPAREVLLAPLVARGSGLGALVCAADGPASSFSATDAALVADLAGRAAVSLDRLQLIDEARRAAKSRDSFISVASHDLRSPLTVLLGQAQILEKRAVEDELGPRILKSVQSIRQQSVRLDRMISVLLDLSRLQAGRLALDLAPVDVVAAVQRVVDELQPTLARHVVTVAADEGGAAVNGDVRRLEEVFQTLISNAIKFSPSGGTVLVRIGADGADVEVAVVDQGIGIAAARLGEIFDQFQRGAAEPRESGLGVGLYVAREIVRLHGGSIAVESEEGAGSTFTVRLPRAE